jgi:hypothetical protein
LPLTRLAACRGVELDALYVDVVVRRYEATTGDPAVLVETGESYHELAARRETEAPTSRSPEAESLRKMGKH